MYMNRVNVGESPTVLILVLVSGGVETKLPISNSIGSDSIRKEPKDKDLY